MIFKKRSDILQHPLEVLENPNLPGIYVVDGLIKHDFLRETYEFLCRECDWRLVINSDGLDSFRYPPSRLPDMMGDNKIWGFNCYDEMDEPPYTITSIDLKYKWIFDLVSYITQQLSNVPFEVWSIHMNGQTSNQDALIHADTGDNLIIYLTPDWKPEWRGEINFYERPEEGEFNRQMTTGVLKKPNSFSLLEHVDYVSGRVVFFHGVKGHREGYKFIPKFINEKPVWHQGRGSSAECSELRISMNVRGKFLYEGVPVNPADPRDGLAEDQRQIRKKNKNLLEEEGE